MTGRGPTAPAHPPNQIFLNPGNHCDIVVHGLTRLVRNLVFALPIFLKPDNGKNIIQTHHAGKFGAASDAAVFVVVQALQEIIAMDIGGVDVEFIASFRIGRKKIAVLFKMLSLDHAIDQFLQRLHIQHKSKDEIMGLTLEGGIVACPPRKITRAFLSIVGYHRCTFIITDIDPKK